MNLRLNVGLELHRLISSEKLFCSCRYQKRKNNFKKFQVQRRDSKVDRFLQDDSYCQYEMDRKPPTLNLKLLKKALNLIKNIPHIKFLEKIVFSRKQILDNSLVKGYQITGLLAHSGRVTLSTGKEILIKRVYLEEDSCSYTPELETYTTCRSGMPLLEVVTQHQELTSDETIELLTKLENLLNKNVNCPKCSFSIRQDLNFSLVNDPNRIIEVKGIDKLSKITALFKTIKKQDFDMPLKTVKFTEEETLVYLRTSKKDKRMSLETDLPIVQTKDYFTKTKNYYFKDLEELALEFKKLIKNKKHLKLLHIWNKKYQINKADLKNFIALFSVHGTKLYKLFFRYLNDELSFDTLKENLYLPCFDEKTLLKLREKNSSKEFYQKYKYNIPRSIKLKKIL